MAEREASDGTNAIEAWGIVLRRRRGDFQGVVLNRQLAIRHRQSVQSSIL